MKTLKHKLLKISLILLIFCLVLNLVTYYTIKPPQFQTLISAKITGTSPRDVFIETFWTVKNPSLLPYMIRKSNMFFDDKGFPIAKIFLDSRVNIKPFTTTDVKVHITVNRTVFEGLLNNSIDLYSFNLQGNMQARITAIPKDLHIDQFMPLDMRSICVEYLKESFQNGVYLERITTTNRLVDTSILFSNRSGFEVYIHDFDGSIQLSNNIARKVSSFRPMNFRTNERQQRTRIRFSEEIPVHNHNFRGKYLLTGELKIKLWDKDYSIPLTMVGEE